MALSNTTQNALRTEYFDDFYEVANTATGLLRGQDFDFHRILFRPRYGVQSRELTQLQTLLQAQIERLGTAQFRDGDRILGAQLTIDTAAISGQVKPTTNLQSFFDRTNNSGLYVYARVAGVADYTTAAHITQYVSIDDAAISGESQTTNNYLIFKYTSTNLFGAGGSIQGRDDDTVTGEFAAGANSTIFHNASTISIDEGVMFVSGLYVRVRPQTIVLNPFDNAPSYRVGVVVNEEILDELSEVIGADPNITVGETLLDEANRGAVGAHRFRISLTLAKRSIDSAADTSFIEIARVIDGQVIYTRANPKYITAEELKQTLARRTYDESGNYILRPFTPVIEGNPNANTSNSEDLTNFRVSLSPGKAYVRGFEVESLAPIRLTIDKARETENANNRSLAAAVGNYVLATRVLADVPNTYFIGLNTVDIHCVNVANILITGNDVYQHSKIGTAKVRMVETESVPSELAIDQFANSVYKLFVYDWNFANTLTGTVADADIVNGQVHITVPVANGTPDVEGAIVGATIILEGASSPVTGTFTIDQYLQHSVANANIVLKEYLTVLPTTSTTFRLLFQPKDVDSFTLLSGGIASPTSLVLNSPYKSNLSFQADVAPSGKLDGTPTGATIVFDTNDNKLFYQIPERFIDAGTIDIAKAEFSTWISSTSTTMGFTTANTNTAIFTFTGGQFSIPEGTYTASTAREYFLVFDITADAVGRGQVIQFADSVADDERAVSDVSVAASGSPVGSQYSVTFKYHHGSTTSSTRTFVAIAKSLVTGQAIRTKTYQVGNTSVAQANTTTALTAGQVEYHTLNVATGFAYSLRTHDVTKLRKVLYNSSNTAFTGSITSGYTDVTDYFDLDTGQRDNSYDYGRAIVKASASSVIAPTGRLLFIFDHFMHSGRGYITLDSYLSNQNIDKGMTYDDIPYYRSPKFGSAVSLRSVLDFRPAQGHYGATNGDVALVFASTDNNANTSYAATDGTTYLIPVSDDIWNGSYDYYLGRRDVVSLGTDGEFHVTKGQSSLTPKTPQVEGSGLLMFELGMPPYTLVSDSGIPTGVTLKSYDYKRYTMNDLSRIENRVSRLEYYTAITQLEQSTLNQSETDADNQERFKNGILVDAFTDGTVADLPRSDFAASLDTRNHQLYPSYRTFAVQFATDFADSTTSGVKIVGDMVVPTYAVADFITQPTATHAVSVNPFDIGTFYGKIQLSPAVDTWKSTDTRPAQVVDLGGPSQAWLDAFLPAYTNWGEWQTTWTGTYQVQTGVRREEVSTGGYWNGQEGKIDENGNEIYARDYGLREWSRDWVETRETVETPIYETRTQSVQERTGTRFNFLSEPQSVSFGNMTVDTTVVHNARKRDIVFSANGLRPAASVYPFFDGTNVQKYVQQANTLRLDSMNVVDAPTFYIGQTVYVKKALTGNVDTASSSATLTGHNTKFDFELLANQLVRIESGINVFDRYISAVTNNTTATLLSTADVTLAGANLFTLTAVTIADITPRYAGSSVTYTLKVVRANRDADSDEAMPYAIRAGSLRPESNAKDTANTSTGATLIVPRSGRNQGISYVASLNINSAVIVSGVVRGYATNNLRLDLDVTDAKVANGAVIYFVGGPGAGQSATITNYDHLNQTAVIDSSTLVNIVPGESIYSIGDLIAEGFLANSTVTAASAGTCAGVFHLQEGRFATGTRMFRLTDSSTNDIAAATTTAETNYVASGLAITQQNFSVTSRNVNVTRRGVHETRFNDNGTYTACPEGWADPLAETFLVDATLYPQGVMVESVDLAFKSKPIFDVSQNKFSDIPVTVELRPVVNGYPASHQLVPCISASGTASVTLRPDAVNTVQDTDVVNAFTTNQFYTRFTFPSLVHLMPGVEYAIVVRSDSAEYTVWTAELGGTIPNTTQKVAKQPYAGSFFKSQNGSTWTESPFEDLAFRINRATWNVESGANSGILSARGILPAETETLDSLVFYPYETVFPNTTSTAYSVAVKPENETVAVTYDVYPNQEYTLAARSFIQGQFEDATPVFYPAIGTSTPTGTIINGVSANTIDALITLTTRSEDVAPSIDLKKMNVVGIRHLINNMSLSNTDFVITKPGTGYANTSAYSGTVSCSTASNTVTGSGTAFSTTLIVGRDVVIDGDVVVTVAAIANDTSFTTTAFPADTRSGKAYATYANLALTISGSNVGEDAAAYAIISGVSSTSASGKVTGVVVTNAGSGYITSPTITVPDSDTNNGASMLYHSEDFVSSGNGLARYFTRPVTLADGFDARDIKVYFDAVRPVGTNFYVYYKVLPGTADTARFVDQNWRLMTQVTNDSVKSNGPNQFREFEFRTPNNRAFDTSTDTTDRFKVFAVKVVMASDDTTLIPRIRNFRAIALDE